MSFDAVIQQEDKFTFVAIPFAPHVVWGKKPRYRVQGTINGIAVHGTLGVFKQAYFLRLSAAWIRHSGVERGSNVIVQLSSVADLLDDNERT